jgi:hypothetical protein
VAIITRSNYKIYASVSGTAYDSVLDIVINGVEDAARRALGRNFTNGLETATRTEDYEATNAGTLQLSEFPVTSITSISPIDGSNTVGTALDSTSYHADLRTGIVYLNGSQSGRSFYDDDEDHGVRSDWGWNPSFGRVRVVYVSAAAELDLVLALYRMVDAGMAAIKVDPTIASQSLGNWSITRRTADDAIRGSMNLLKPFVSGAAGVA